MTSIENNLSSEIAHKYEHNQNADLYVKWRESRDLSKHKECLISKKIHKLPNKHITLFSERKGDKINTWKAKKLTTVTLYSVCKTISYMKKPSEIDLKLIEGIPPNDVWQNEEWADCTQLSNRYETSEDESKEQSLESEDESNSTEKEFMKFRISNCDFKKEMIEKTNEMFSNIALNSSDKPNNKSVSEVDVIETIKKLVNNSKIRRISTCQILNSCNIVNYKEKLATSYRIRDRIIHCKSDSQCQIKVEQDKKNIFKKQLRRTVSSPQFYKHVISENLEDSTCDQTLSSLGKFTATESSSTHISCYESFGSQDFSSNNFDKPMVESLEDASISETCTLNENINFEPFKRDYVKEPEHNSFQDYLRKKETKNFLHINYHNAFFLHNTTLNKNPFMNDFLNQKKFSDKINRASNSNITKFPMASITPSNSFQQNTNLHLENNSIQIKIFKKKLELNDNENCKDSNVLLRVLKKKSGQHICKFKKEKSKKRNKKDHVDHQSQKGKKSLFYTDEFNVSYISKYTYLKLPRLMDPNLGLMNSFHDGKTSTRIEIMNAWTSTLILTQDLNCSIVVDSQNEEFALVVGGIDPLMPKDYLLGGSMFLLNLKQSNWQYFGTIPEPRCYHTCCVLNNRLYIIGGYSPFLHWNGDILSTPTTYCLDLKTNKWFRLTDLNIPRACHASTVFDQKIYVFGGRDNLGRLQSTIEEFCPIRDNWRILTNMPKPMMGCGIAVCGKLIYLVGGITMKDYSSSFAFRYVSSIYSFDPRIVVWKREMMLPESRAYCSAIEQENKVWIFGGCTLRNNKLISLAAVDVYTPQTNSWEQRFFLRNPRHALSICKIDNEIIAVGGISDYFQTSLSDAEIINSKSIKSVTSLPSSMAGMCLVTIPSAEI